MESKIANYWDCLDSVFDDLLSKGYAKLPSLKNILSKEELENVRNKAKDQLSDKTFLENSESHNYLLDKLDVRTFLNPKIKTFLSKNFGFKEMMFNQYNVTRMVSPGNSKEQYRAHYDSHMITIVYPILVPEIHENRDAGQLIFFPFLRKEPKSELSNFITKLFDKRFASKSGIEGLQKSKISFIEAFERYEPLIFLGRTTFHTNKPVSSEFLDPRITFLSHYCDPTPELGIGSILRKIRNR